MTRFDDERVDPYEIVERHWPYDGPYNDELTSAAALMIARLGRYLNNVTQKQDGLPDVTVVGRVVGELHAAVTGYEQLLTQLARYTARLAEADTALYDDRRDRPGAVTAYELATDLRVAVDEVGQLSGRLASAAQRASHLGTGS